MSENEDLEVQDVLADLVEEDVQSELTPEQLRAELTKVRREAAKHRTEKQEARKLAEELQKYKDAEKTELERLTERAQRAESELQATRREKAARDAAKAAGLDSDLADLVRGETEEELAESAKALAERLAAKAPSKGNFNSGGGSAVTAVTETPNQAFRKLFL